LELLGVTLFFSKKTRTTPKWTMQLYIKEEEEEEKCIQIQASITHYAPAYYLSSCSVHLLFQLGQPNPARL
jgi:hypothetical protein